METSREQASTTASDDQNVTGWEITPAYCCSWYLCSTFLCILLPLICVNFLMFLGGKDFCYLELFADSVSVTSTNASTSDCRFVLAAKTPVSSCKIKLHTVKSRLLQGDEVISQLPPWVDGFGQLVTFDNKDGRATTVDFNGVVMKPGVKSGVVWDFRVEIVVAVRTDIAGHGYLDVNCLGIPLNFTVDPMRNVVNGLLLGNSRRCEYVFQNYLDPYV